MFADAVPRPLPFFDEPAGAPSVAQDTLEGVVVDVSRPSSRGFQAREYLEGFDVPSVDVVAAYVYYRTGVGRIARALEEAWRRRGAAAESRSGNDRFVRFVHGGNPSAVIEEIESLQERHLP